MAIPCVLTGGHGKSDISDVYRIDRTDLPLSAYYFAPYIAHTKMLPEREIVNGIWSSIW